MPRAGRCRHFVLGGFVDRAHKETNLAIGAFSRVRQPASVPRDGEGIQYAVRRNGDCQSRRRRRRRRRRFHDTRDIVPREEHQHQQQDHPDEATGYDLSLQRVTSRD